MLRPQEKLDWIEPGTSLWDLTCRRADVSPTASMATDELGRTLTFGEYRVQCSALAADLSERGVRAGDVVVWQMPTWFETVVLAGALDLLRTIQTPILPQLRAREVTFIAAQVDAAWYVHPGIWHGYDYAALGDRLRTGTASRLGLIEIGRPHRRSTPRRNDPLTLLAAEGVDSRNEHWYFYTSGTTGVPKGVRHGHTAVAAATVSMCRGMRIRADDVSVLAFPFTHIGGINWLMAALITGCSLLVIEAFAAVDTMDVIAGHPVTLAGVTTAFHLAYLAEQRARGASRPLLPKIRAYPGGAAPKPRALQQDLIDTIGGVGIVSGFGLTEFPMITMNSVEDPPETLATTEGHPSADVEVAIIGPDGRRCGPGEDGEICARGPHRMLGYVDASLDASVFDADGFFHTGDLGQFDADGFLTVTGRLKDVIVRKGENVSAREVEELIFGHPAVADVAVVGLPDGQRGELVCAVITVARGSSLTFDEVIAHLHDQEIMSRKLPERVVFVDELPRNGAGKVLKSELRDRLTTQEPR